MIETSSRFAPPPISRSRLERAGHVDYVGWFLRLLGWDIVLTAVVAIAPVIVQLVLPGNADAIRFIAVPLPILAFVLRACSGWYHIQANGCDIEMRQQQASAFMLALVMLVTFDTMMIMSHIMPAPAPLAQIDYCIYGGLFLLYLGLMAYAMYPDRVKRAEEWASLGRGGRLWATCFDRKMGDRKIAAEASPPAFIFLSLIFLSPLRSLRPPRLCVERRNDGAAADAGDSQTPSLARRVSFRRLARLG